MLGGVPRVMGGGGLEIQVDSTRAALESRGHRVRDLHTLGHDDGFDVLHAFHSEPLLHGLLPHWKRNRSPLVVSPVLPIGPGTERRLLWLSARAPGPISTARMRRQVLRQADAIVALTEFEREILCGVFAAPVERIAVIPNGVQPVGSAVDLPAAWAIPDQPYLLMVGNVSRRKRQSDVLEGSGRHPVVVVGGLLDEDRMAFERLVAESGSHWLGPIADARRVRALQARAGALVLLSDAEALSLAVLESLSVGTPVIVSDLPSHRELARAHPGWVWLVDRPESVGAAFERILATPPPATRPAIPDWGMVAGRLEALYVDVLSGPRSMR